MIIDYHLHNHFSCDSESETSDIAKKAIKLGIQEVCITNHVETFDPETGDGLFSYEEATSRFTKVKKEIEETQKNFPNLPIKFGVELEYVKPWMSDMKRFVDAMDFDFMIGSVHAVDGVIISSSELSSELYEKVTEQYSYSKYFENLYKMVEWGSFSAVGHFDICKKGGYKFYGPFNPQKYKNQITDVLELMKKKGIGIELNTRYMHKDCNEIFPHPDILKWCVEIGVEHYTIGSDAHTAEEVGQNFEEALTIAKEAGITSLSTYEKQRPTKHKI
ncbi:histidinol-phosphatase [Patescibacteria group bacterium]|nr:histidinol-phosphatase [Patescibacteria group bacterium]MBU1683542.1 histidinol-phosphatase [Patescibacteria group bacterium]MBU1935006.1 histidinol-phosphatase [Patescibacteria group bacterium]